MGKKQLAPSDAADKFMLRMPDGMRDRISEAAKKNNRSMNSEMIARLEQTLSFESGVFFGNEPFAAVVDGMLKRIEAMQARIDRLETKK